MFLILKRMFQSETETIGKIVYNNEIICYTLEDIKRDKKVYGKTRIPKGTYKITPRKEGGMVQRYRQQYGKDHYMLWIRDVPNFEYILIHKGNFSENSEGCVLTGAKYEVDENGKYYLMDSKGAYLRLWNLVDSKIKMEDVLIIIMDEED